MEQNIVFPAFAELTEFGFDAETLGGWKCFKYTDCGVSVPFIIYIPNNYRVDGNYPIMLHLNGDGSRGKTLAEAFETGETAAPKRLIRDTDGQAIVLIPVTPDAWLTTPEEENVVRPRRKYDMGGCTPSNYMLASENLLMKIAEKFAVDDERVYLSGYSRGCMGGFYLLHKHGERYSAAVLAAGASDPKATKTWIDTPAWMFIAKNDDIISPVDFTEVYEAAKKYGNENVRLTVFDHGKHGIGGQIYDIEELAEWLLSQTKSGKRG